MRIARVGVPGQLPMSGLGSVFCHCERLEADMRADVDEEFSWS